MHRAIQLGSSCPGTMVSEFAELAAQATCQALLQFSAKCLNEDLANLAAGLHGHLMQGRPLLGCAGYTHLNLLYQDPDGAVQTLKRELEAKYGEPVGVYETFMTRNEKGTSSALQARLDPSLLC